MYGEEVLVSSVSESFVKENRGMQVSETKAFLLYSIFCWTLLFQFSGKCDAQNDKWCSFRGNSSSGWSSSRIISSRDGKLEEVWEVDIPGQGYSTPVVYGDSIFLTNTYYSSGNKHLRIALNWAAPLCVSGLCIIVFLHTLRNNNVSLLRCFVMSAQVWALFGTVLLGRHLFACHNTTYRVWIFTTIPITLLLLVLKNLSSKIPWLSGFVVAGGIIATGLFISCFPFWTSILQRTPGAYSVALASFLLPAAVAMLASLERLPNSFIFRIPLSTFFRLIAAISPILVLAGFAIKNQHLSFWSIQPTHELVLPRGFYWIIVGLSIWIGLIVLSSYFFRKLRVLVALYGSLLCTLLLPTTVILVLVNNSRILKFHLLRGSVDSDLGFLNAVILAGIVFLSPLLIYLARAPGHDSITHRKSAHRSTYAAFCQLLLAILTPVFVCWNSFGASYSGLIHAIVAIDSSTGEHRWTSEGIVDTSTTVDSFNSTATPSPVVTTDSVAAYFGANGAFMCSRNDGSVKWINTDLPYHSNFGVASSLASVSNGVIVQSDSDAIDSYVVSLSNLNGQPNWRHIRETVASWRSPVAFDWGGQKMICTWASTRVDIYEAHSGELLKSLSGVDCGAGDPIVSPVFDGKKLWFTGTERVIGISISELMATRNIELAMAEICDTDPVISGAGEPIGTAAIIDLDYDGPICSTPSCTDGFLILISAKGKLLCISTKDNAVLWTYEVGPTSSSPLIAADYIYCLNDEGRLRVFALGRRAVRQVVCEIALPDKAKASPVAANNRLYIRTEKKLYCFKGQ